MFLDKKKISDYGTLIFYYHLKCSSAELFAANNLSGTEATGADTHFGRLAVDNDMHGLDIRRPACSGLTIGVAYQVSGHNALSTYFTIFTHRYQLLYAYALAFAATSQSSLKAFRSVTARSARTLRLISTPATFRPLIRRL